MNNKPFKGCNKKTLFTIGDMANLFHMNIRTLRYYDKCGILKPEYVDPQTNYRYYSTNQFERLNTIKYLRALDVSIEKIENFFNEKDENTMLSIFIEQRENVINKQIALSRIEKKITNRIEQIETALSETYGVVVIKHFPQRKIVSLEENFSATDDLEPLIRNLSKDHNLDTAIFLGKVGVAISREDLMQERFSCFSSIFIIMEDEDSFNNGENFLINGKYATIYYQGTHEEATPYYALLLNYIKKSGFQIAGNSVEITIIDDGITNNRNKFVTELQIPFK